MIRHSISKEELDSINNINVEGNATLQSLNDDLTAMREDGGQKVALLDNTQFLPTGTRAYALTMTEQHKKWLAKLQENNPLIGKDYFAPAPEYTENSEIDEAKEMSEEEKDSITETYVDENGNTRVGIKEDYDPNDSQKVEEDDKLSMDERNIMDFSLIKNKVTANLEWKIDDLFNDIEDSLKELHSDDENYIPPPNLKEVVSAMQNSEKLKLLVFNKKNNK